MSLPRPTRPASADAKARSEGLSTKKPIQQKDLRPSDMFRFEPQSDNITVAELAELVSSFFEIDIHSERFLRYPTSLQRHFRRIKTS